MCMLLVILVYGIITGNNPLQSGELEVNNQHEYSEVQKEEVLESDRCNIKFTRVEDRDNEK
ncbi:hypothetical protein [Oceanobacillus caeni]|uniref:hypothetical protein n=2 Tax=Bacillaceae TaxID=186817 RepID=UPI002E1D6FE8|nr:hypothetical protein [Oceanobacillus caeni]